jgi:hypothetical protein
MAEIFYHDIGGYLSRKTFRLGQGGCHSLPPQAEGAELPDGVCLIRGRVRVWGNAPHCIFFLVLHNIPKIREIGKYFSRFLTGVITFQNQVFSHRVARCEARATVRLIC